ncbi:metalloprotease [Kitasatospora sp. NPDC004669]|uniref:metalloprotease n=1 Tax=Kitasatospora sp. NPDC004669 TaxID=3154555 RepID=UPI0033BF8EE0
MCPQPRTAHLPAAASATGDVGAGRRAAARRRAGVVPALAVLTAVVALASCSSSGGTSGDRAVGSAPADTGAPPTTGGPGRICLTGTLAYDHHDAEAGPDKVKQLTTSVARGTTWQLWGRTSASGAEQLLATGRTDQHDGRFEACSDQTGPLPELHLTFRSSNGNLWKAVDPTTRAEYSFDTPHLTDIAASRDLGTVKAPAEQQGAWKIVDTLGDLYRKANAANTTGSPCWTDHQSAGGCDELTFTWSPTATKGGFFDPESRDVVLAAEDPDSRHLILHEAGHWLHFELSDHWFPDAPGCENHTFEVASTGGCAWTEAFADAVAAYTLGDHRYVYSDGQSVDLHNDPTTTWDKGDTVQGRIGGSLLDLWAADGPDGGSWNKDLQLMARYHAADFREYFTVYRPKAGLPTTGPSRQIIGGHTIDY